MDRRVYERMDKQEAHHWLLKARRDILQTTIECLISLPQITKISEAGCGTGGNLAMLQEFGQLDAFEFDDGARYPSLRLLSDISLLGHLKGKAE